MIKQQCQLWSQTPPLSTARPICDKTKNKDFMKSAGFHENHPYFKTKDHLQGMVTPMFSQDIW